MASNSDKDITDVQLQETITDFLSREQNVQYLLDPGDDNQSTILAVSSESTDDGTSGNQVTYIEVVKEKASCTPEPNESVLALYRVHPENIKDPGAQKQKEICIDTKNTRAAMSGCGTNDARQVNSSFPNKTMETDKSCSETSGSDDPKFAGVDPREQSADKKRQDHHPVFHSKGYCTEISSQQDCSFGMESKVVDKIKQEIKDCSSGLSTSNSSEKQCSMGDKLVQRSMSGCVCDVCGDEFLQDWQLKCHKQLSHSNQPEDQVAEKGFRCFDGENILKDIKSVAECFKPNVADLQSLKIPEQLQSTEFLGCYVKLERLQECDVCKLIVSGYTELKEHWNNKHAEQDDGDILEEHLQNEHKSHDDGDSFRIEDSPDSDEDAIPRKSKKRRKRKDRDKAPEGHLKAKHTEQEHKCPQCGVNFKNKYFLEIHVLQEHLKETQCAKCGKVFETVALLAEHNAENTCCKCPECGRQYDNKRQLSNHKSQKHSKLKRFKETQCEKCDKVFDTVDLLIEHKTKDTCAKCPECPRKFPHKSRIRQHVEYCHRSDKFLQCPHCPATCKLPVQLRDHIRSHTGERPFVCQICQYSFSVRRALQKHMKSHNKEKEYKFMCEVCGSRFIDGYVLERHRRVHTGEKPFKCHICSSAHSTGSALKIHIRTHTGEKPYMCSECGQGYIAYSCLKSHMQNRHGMALKIEK